jgi:prepilin-type N-terminal cleavage/methylation domain-containing protein
MAFLNLIIKSLSVLFISKIIKSDNNRAFTLIELIVVISLISILFAFTLPRLDISLFENQKRKVSSWILLNVKSLKESALRTQSLYVLAVDFDKNKMWTARAPITEETQATSEYKIPAQYQLMDVMLTDNEKISEGIVTIKFYPKGYSDRALIHIEDKNDNRYTYQIEPFLPHVKIKEEYIEF